MTTLRWSLVVVLAAVVPAPALACGFCLSLTGDPLTLPHPKAIEIAVATRSAIEKGQLNEKRLFPQETVFESGSGLIALSKVPAPLLVKAWAKKCGCPRKGQAPWNVHFLFIDTDEACGLSLRGGAVVFEAKPSAHSDALVVTTRIAFAALLNGSLGLQEARQHGLVYLEGDACVAGVLLTGD